jgi:DNA topoisomerase-1
VNATLPKTLKPEDVTLEVALQLIDAKGGAAPAKSRGGARKAPAKKKVASSRKVAAE